MRVNWREGTRAVRLWSLWRSGGTVDPHSAPLFGFPCQPWTVQSHFGCITPSISLLLSLFFTSVSLVSSPMRPSRSRPTDNTTNSAVPHWAAKGGVQCMRCCRDKQRPFSFQLASWPCCGLLASLSLVWAVKTPRGREHAWLVMWVHDTAGGRRGWEGP